MEMTYMVVGTLGLLLLLGAFVYNLAGKMSSESRTYLLLNIIGCMFLTYYAVALHSIPFMILEGVWGLSSLVKLIILWKTRGNSDGVRQ